MSHATTACLLFLTGAGIALAPPAEAVSPATASGSFHLPAPCARALPYFTALGEKAWAQGWKPRLLSGATQRGSVFVTRHAQRQTTWIVVDYDPSAGRASYARLVEGSNMGLVDVHCANESRGARVQVTYTLTGLDDAGRAVVADFLDAGHYRAMLEEWRQALTATLTPGG